MTKEGESMSNTVAMWIICAFVTVSATTMATTAITGHGKKDKALEYSIRTEGKIDLVLQAIETLKEDVGEIKENDKRQDRQINANARPRKTSINGRDIE